MTCDCGSETPPRDLAPPPSLLSCVRLRGGQVKLAWPECGRFGWNHRGAAVTPLAQAEFCLLARLAAAKEHGGWIKRVRQPPRPLPWIELPPSRRVAASRLL